jgi:hypothetical protein
MREAPSADALARALTRAEKSALLGNDQGIVGIKALGG